MLTYTARLTHSWKSEAERLRDLLAMERRKSEIAEQRVAAMYRREAELLRLVRELQARIDRAPLLTFCDGRAA